MAITLPFADEFSSGSDIDTGVYTKLAAGTYTVSGGYVKVNCDTVGNDDEGFYTTDTISGDFVFEVKAQQTIVDQGTVHEIQLMVDANNYISMFRYYRSDLGWYNPGCRKVVAGTTTDLVRINSAEGDTWNAACDIWYRIQKIGQVFTFWTSRDGSAWTQRYMGTISDWTSGQTYKILLHGFNDYLPDTFKVDYIHVDPTEIVTSYEGSNDDFENMGTGATVGQSFQVSADKTVKSIAIYGARGNASSGTFKVEILSGSMTGTVLTTTGTLTSSSALTAYAGGAQWNQLFVTPVDLTAGVTYYLRLTALSGSSNDEVRWSTDTTSPSYASGSQYAGSTEQATRDKNFRIYGYDPPAIVADAEVAPLGVTVTAAAVSANYTSIVSASVTPLSLSVNFPSVAASYSLVTSASVLPITLQASIASITAYRYIDTETQSNPSIASFCQAA